MLILKSRATANQQSSPDWLRSELLSLVYTKQFFSSRRKDGDPQNPVAIPMAYFEKFFPCPQYKASEALGELVKMGLLQRGINEYNGYTYKALKPVKINPLYIGPRGKLNPLTKTMMNHLAFVDLPALPTLTKTDQSMYFEAFLHFRDRGFVRYFFTPDNFSGRVHTPITSLPKEYRRRLTLDGEPVVLIDLVTSQPLLLGAILKQNIGANEFSTWIDEGKDVYLLLQEKAGLPTRKEAKERFFQIAFSKPSEALEQMFGSGSWIKWVNWFKAQEYPPNPHSKQKPYSNIAYLLQSLERVVMGKVWQGLAGLNIPFLTVHDEIIVKLSDRKKAAEVFETVLSKEVAFFRLETTLPPDPKPGKAPEPKSTPLARVEDSGVTKTARVEDSGVTKKAVPRPQSGPEARTGVSLAAIEELKEFFSTHTPPDIMIISGVRTDTAKMIAGHLPIAEANRNNYWFNRYYERLAELKSRWNERFKLWENEHGYPASWD